MPLIQADCSGPNEIQPLSKVACLGRGAAGIRVKAKVEFSKHYHSLGLWPDASDYDESHFTDVLTEDE